MMAGGLQDCNRTTPIRWSLVVDRYSVALTCWPLTAGRYSVAPTTQRHAAHARDVARQQDATTSISLNASFATPDR
jgi:hypothetical protein